MRGLFYPQYIFVDGQNKPVNPILHPLAILCEIPKHRIPIGCIFTCFNCTFFRTHLRIRVTKGEHEWLIQFDELNRSCLSVNCTSLPYLSWLVWSNYFNNYSRIHSTFITMENFNSIRLPEEFPFYCKYCGCSTKFYLWLH